MLGHCHGDGSPVQGRSDTEQDHQVAGSYSLGGSRPNRPRLLAGRSKAGPGYNQNDKKMRYPTNSSTSADELLSPTTNSDRNSPTRVQPATPTGPTPTSPLTPSTAGPGNKTPASRSQESPTSTTKANSSTGPVFIPKGTETCAYLVSAAFPQWKKSCSPCLATTTSRVRVTGARYRR